MQTVSFNSAEVVPSWTVGELAVHRVDEAPLPAPTGRWLLPGATAEVVARHDWLRPDFADRDGTLRLASHSFAFSVGGGLRVLVDTGIGNGKPRANPAWHDLRTDYPERLEAAGFPPDSVDLVLLTHLHTDHVGWNTRAQDGDWVPTFPNARYVTSRTEREFWAGHPMDEARARMFRDSVHPVEEAGQLDLVDLPEAGLDLAPGLRLLPPPGHTPGHFASRSGSTAPEKPRCSPATASTTPCSCRSPGSGAAWTSTPGSPRPPGAPCWPPSPTPARWSWAPTSRRPPRRRVTGGAGHHRLIPVPPDNGPGAD